MAARGNPLMIVAPLAFAGLAAGFVGLYLWRQAAPSQPPAALDARVREVDAALREADTAEKAGRWDLARAALQRASALEPSNATIRGRLDEAAEEEKRSALLAEADAARRKGDSAAEAARLAEARRIREEADLRGRQAAAELAAGVARAQAAEKSGAVPLAIEAWRQVASAASSEDVVAYATVHPDEVPAEASPASVQKKIAELQALLQEGEKEALKAKAEGAAAEGLQAKKEGRMTTAVARLTEAIGVDARDEWRKALEEAKAYVADSDKFLNEGLAAYEKQDWDAAKGKVELALTLNKECAAALRLLPEIRTRSARKGMIPVPAATVSAGGSEVKVRAFYIEPTEVSEAQYFAYLRAQGLPLPPRWREAGRPPGDGSSPMQGVSAKEAEAYAAWAGRRLPTEAEWLAAAGAADGRKYPWGAEWDAAKANAKSDAPWLCGSRAEGASPCGARDMAGNVAEWTATSEGGRRVAKGGSFLFPPSACELTWRWLDDEDLGFPGFGFRCAADGDEEK